MLLPAKLHIALIVWTYYFSDIVSSADT